MQQELEGGVLAVKVSSPVVGEEDGVVGQNAGRSCQFAAI